MSINNNSCWNDDKFLSHRCLKCQTKNVPRSQFYQRFTRAFFIRMFVQSQNVTRKKAFVRNRCAKNVDEIDSRTFQTGR
jgi:hypothetical protein